MNPETTPEKMIERSIEMWGEERTQANRENVEGFAGALKVLSENLPRREQQPGFCIL